MGIDRSTCVAYYVQTDKSHKKKVLQSVWTVLDEGHKDHGKKFNSDMNYHVKTGHKLGYVNKMKMMPVLTIGNIFSDLFWMAMEGGSSDLGLDPPKEVLDLVKEHEMDAVHTYGSKREDAAIIKYVYNSDEEDWIFEIGRSVWEDPIVEQYKIIQDYLMKLGFEQQDVELKFGVIAYTS